MSNHNSIILDVSKVRFISANQFAILGAIIEHYLNSNPSRNFSFRGVPEALMKIMRKNGFGKYLNLPSLNDIYGTTIPYKRFSVDDITEYDLYLRLKLFSRNDLPQMSPLITDNIRSYLLEVFKNVKDHTTSSRVYTCGQYFPHSYMLFLTIVDMGETIPYNVHKYHEKHNSSVPRSTLRWALQEGHSTLDKDGPRGIGLSLIKEFIIKNKGCFYIVSEKEAYEITKNGERYKELDYSFPGTIVTIAFNLKDNYAYYMKEEVIPTIQF